ncbi:hypothetical protein BUALT_Bualt14G0064500 [Buddleja alternifolia]|uniref:E3 ubiquitin-protein ligase LIN-1 n=1 Tax=Buddleja alternifolia TaxID=168488 RepID=A0AAV6WSI5_9LAMI|nr:hypothetical protein BUALT_Bualt14G0064500 [Buddleja alternifolia]
MSKHPMASIPPPSPLNFSDGNKKLDLNSVRELIAIINHHMHAIIDNTQTLKSLKSRCSSKLNIQSQQFFEFSEHSVLSNLYSGMESTEAAARSVTMEDKAIRLEKSEKMLQIPASLDENGVTLGIFNSHLICVSYFYLSLVELLRKNEWQMAVHFLQAVLISPRDVYTEFAPRICQSLFPLFFRHRDEKLLSNEFVMSDFDDEVGNRGNCVSLPGDQSLNVVSSGEQNYPQDYVEDTVTSLRTRRNNAKALNRSSIWDLKAPERTVSTLQASRNKLQREINETKVLDCISRKKFALEQSGVLEKIISKLCFTEGLGNGEEDCMVEMKMIYEILSNKSGLKYSLLKDIILDQLLTAISTSNEERVVRTSMAILTTIVSENRSVIEDIKKKGLQLYDLATALKRNVHEAVILIYLINPSPAEIKTLELLPCLVEVVCTSKSYKVEFTSLLLTPPAASLMIIEVLVTSFDIETNSMHLAAISSPRVLSELVQVPRKDNLEEFISLAAILVKCMRFDGKCRKYILEFSPVAPFVSLLWSNQKRATSVALEFFNELLRMPRSSAIDLLEQIQKHGNINNMCALFLLTQNSEPEYRVLAANLLLQLEVLEDKSTKCIYREEATEALLESLTCEESPATQALAAYILSNLGGTYSWTGEPYTMAWLVKKTGLTLGYHQNLIKKFDFLDQSLQDAGIDSWCSKIAQRILILGAPIFHALVKGLNSKLKRVSRDCLIATAWLGCELVKGPDELRHAASEIVLHSIEQYMHPGSELEERLLACLCIYNYTSGRGMRKIVNLSEGVRESLRRLSNVTWMAEELLKVADYFQPNKWRISCVHSQILEVGNKSSGAVTALIYYKGQLYSGYTDGSIKVWDINGQSATLVHEIKEHKKAVACFALYEPGNCLLSGSADKTIKMWQMLQRNLECIEVIPTKESIKSIDSSGELIFLTTQTHKLKVIDASRKTKDVFKNKRVKCVKLSQGKVYAGCTDSSIQELMITNNRHQEIKGPSKKVSLKGASILAMEVIKTFIWLRGTQHKKGVIKVFSLKCKLIVFLCIPKGCYIMNLNFINKFIEYQCDSELRLYRIWFHGMLVSVTVKSNSLFHLWLHAQALTLAALAGAAVVEYYDHKTGAKAERVAKFLDLNEHQHKD